MFVSGFTFIRNAVKLDYPVQEAIKSILPLVDEMVVAVGNSDDETRNRVEELGEKIRIIDTLWDDSLRKGGEVLAVETNKALSHVDPRADWCFYIQADECVHEKYHDTIKQALIAYRDKKEVEGLLFKYLHFYGSYDFVGDSRTWYRNEVRIVKPVKGLRSYKDAQGFRIDDRKLNVVAIDAYIYHYGWVRHPKFQMAKQLEAHKLWHSDDYVQKKFDAALDFDYSEIDSIVRFQGTHPQVMKQRIRDMNWSFDRDPQVKNFNLKQRLLYLYEKLTGVRIGEYKNYKIIHPRN